MNFFAHASAAERYARSRPYFHPVVIERIKTHLELTKPVARALDVACGTGQSSVALQIIAQHVTGTDISSAMLEFARQNRGIEFLESNAEKLPFEAETFDIITVSNSFHWFDCSSFLTEANRVLKPNGWLIVYYNAWRSDMLENQAAFKAWSDQHFARYPQPKRSNQPMTESDAVTHGFRFDPIKTYENTVQFTLEQCVDYLSTQSNMIAKLEQGTEHLDDAVKRMQFELEPLFLTPTATFGFAGWIWYLQKDN